MSSWCVYAWIYLMPGTISTAKLLQLTTSDNKLLYVTWPTSSDATFTYNGASVTAPTGNRQENKWFRVTVGTFAGALSYGFISLRLAASNVFTTPTWGEMSLGNMPSFMGPVDAYPFYVSCR